MRRHLTICALLTCGLAAILAPEAGATNVHELTFGSSGGAAGQLNAPRSIAHENATGHVYVADTGNNRIQEFDATGTSVRIFGYDVVASGPSNQPNANEVQKVTIKAVGGAFRLNFNGQNTAPVAFDAPASGAGSVEAALNALSNVGPGGVSVAGGPGDETGSTPYVVTFSGGLVGGLDVSPLSFPGELQSLGLPVGTPITCSDGGSATEKTFQWMRNGTPIGGATSAGYTPVAEDSGKALQCRVTSTTGAISTVGFNQPPVHIGAVPKSAPLIPLPPSSISAPSGSTLSVGGENIVMTCNAGVWQNSPTAYTYQWLRNGAVVETETLAATTDTYTATKADLEASASFQCLVTGENAAGKSSQESTRRFTSPQPSGVPSVSPNVTVSGSFSPTVQTIAPGGAVYEVCVPVAPTNDVCKAGTAGNQSGQLSGPRGVAVDNSAGPTLGTIYVQDNGNRRIQKFTPGAAFERMWGIGVNQTTTGNVCVAGSGDVCKEAQNFGGSGNPPVGGFQWESTDDQGVAVDDSGTIYVVDRPEGDGARITRFDSSGAVLDHLRWTGDNRSWMSIALDPGTANVYALPLFPAVAVKFTTADFSVEGTGATRDAVIEIGGTPAGIAVDPVNHYLQVGERNTTGAACGGGSGNYALLAFDTAGNEADCTHTASPFQISSSSVSRGLAVSPSRRLFVVDRSSNNVKVFALPVAKAPSFTSEADNLTTETATLRAFINPNFSDTNYSIELGPATCTEVANPCSELESGGPIRGTKPLTRSITLEELTPGTVYHYRIIAENGLGKVIGPDRTFQTWPALPDVDDPCTNASARQQTGTALMLDCRAYELVSAEYTGGYDVRSDLVSGQEFYGGFPEAEGKVLYSVLDGGIPDSGAVPTNRGPDPYVATRGESSWSTEYVGIPANINAVSPPFSSTVAGATADLTTFAFGGPEICAPCFLSGIESGLPLRLSGGGVVQGMAGPQTPAATSDPAGFVRERFSGDGSHLLFGSTAKFHADGNGNGSDLTIYDRNLDTDTTQVVSKLPNGTTMTGSASDIAALDISEDGSRILIGKRVSTDSAGNEYWDLYMHIGAAPNTVAVADTAGGVLFNGMTETGAEVLFTTPDPIATAGDLDMSADLFHAQVSEVGATVTRLSTGISGTGNTNACDPAPNGSGNNWNAVGGASVNGCGTVAIADEGGLASESGDVFFLSPEKLDGASNGVQDEPNLYISAAGSPPHFVATLEPDNSTVVNAVADNDVRKTADFQVTAQGSYAVFVTREPLDPTYDNAGKAMVYRYNSQADSLDCVSCIQTDEVPAGDASLASDGLSVSRDGRVFFNSPDPLVLRDSSAKLDAYEWKEGEVQLISTGTSPFGASLLTVSEDGRDAFFFTRDQIVPTDRNGSAMKVYDARENGGFFVIPKSPPCAASDECHGPSSQAVPPAKIGTFKSNGSNAGPQGKRPCPKGKVRRKGKCVKRKKSRRPQRVTKNSQGGSR